MNPAPGIYSGISMSDYHGGPGVSRSDLDLVLRSPAHYWAARLDPEREAEKDTPALIFGRLLHAMVLEPDEASKAFLPAPAMDRRTKAGKDAWAELEAMAAGRTIIGADDWTRATRMAECVRAHPTVKALLARGKAEQTMYWQDATTKLLCRARTDWLAEKDEVPYLLDLKTTMDARKEQFARDCFRYGYHRQAAWYTRGYEAIAGRTPVFGFIVAEKEPPFAVALYTLDAFSIDLGRRECEKALETYAACKKSDVWPGYGAKAEQISLPPWAFEKEIEE